jgi:hypothetical protein
LAIFVLSTLQLHDKNGGKGEKKEKKKPHDTQPTNKIIYKKAKKSCLFSDQKIGGMFSFFDLKFHYF